VRFFIGVASLSLLASIDVLLPFQFLDNRVQLVEACVPELAVPVGGEFPIVGSKGTRTN
jgi:hypothetical protein